MIQPKKMKQKAAWFSLLLAALFFSACGGDTGIKDQQQSETPATETAAAGTPGTGQVKMQEAGKIPEGWKQASWDKFKFWIPADWKKESGTDVWCPPGESFATGLPTISLHCGEMPVMGQSVDEQVKMMLHGSPISQTPLNKCGMPGHIREARDNYGLRHLTLTLEEGGVMTVVNFFNCRVPEDQYSKYEETYRKILESVHCN